MKENGLMKKLLGVVLLAGVLAFVWTATKPEPALVPLTECPLEAETVRSAVEQVGLPWLLSEPETHSNHAEHMGYVLRDPVKTLREPEPGATYEEDYGNHLLYASVNSAIIEGERFLNVQLWREAGPAMEDRQSVPPFAWEDWQQPIQLATLLYGFEDADRVYEVFSRMTIEQPDPETGSRTTWETEVDGVWCRMEWLVWPPRPYGSRSYELAVRFYESKDLCERLDEEREQARQEALERQAEREAAKAADK